MKILLIIQARTGSTRLPSKVLLNLEGKTVLEQVIRRAKASKLTTDTLLATTISKSDLPILEICIKNNIQVFCGSENDVLDRFYQSAKLFSPDHIVRITADCPIIDPSIIDNVIDVHLKQKNDYTSNTLDETFPDGEDVEVFTFAALKNAWENAKLLSEREHVTPFIRNNSEIFKIGNVSCAQNLSNKRWTLDNPEDYEFIKKVYSELYKQNELFGMNEVLSLLQKKPELEKINSAITRNLGYIKSVNNDKEIKK
ncbi:MAG: glycosyltransferase family protein [Endomicrobiales bacterium]|nr:glycosyltransferase family protein [Endomicrobiales bacterium]